MKTKNYKKNKGVLIWITGLSGSGKSTIAKKIYPDFVKIFGKTIVINGDDLRKIFKLYGFDEKDRYINAIKFSKLCKLITDQNVSIIFAAVGMKNNIRKIFKSSVKNYFEIFIESSINKIKKKNLKKTDRKFKSNIVGYDIKPEFPNKPDIKVKNNFDRNVDDLIKELSQKISEFRFRFL